MNFDKMLRCRGWIYHKVQCNVTSTNLEHCIRLPQTPCRRLVIFFAVTHNMLFNGPDTNLMAVTLSSSMWFLGPNRIYPPISISIGSVVFARVTNVTNRHTDRHTDHATPSVSNWRVPYALSACDMA